MCGTGVVVFNYATWAASYPELSAYVNATQAQGYFNRACLQLDNTGCSLVRDSSVGGQRETLLYMLTSHIAALNAPLNGSPSPTLVGRISTATEGSVSVAVENQYPPGTVQWFQQTKYGSEYWAASAGFRTMRYAPRPGPIGPIGPFGFRGR